MTTRLQKNVKQYFKDNIGIIGALLILCIFLSVFPKTSGSFLTQKNIFNVLRQISSNLFLACGMTMVIILGGIDLSVGSIIALSGCFAAGCVSRYGLPIAVGVLGGVLVGTVVGMFNGVVISKTTIPPFIVTLATMYIQAVHLCVWLQRNGSFWEPGTWAESPLRLYFWQWCWLSRPLS